jgi:hypothetical protein
MVSAGNEHPDAYDSGHGPQFRISQNNPSNKWQVCNERDIDVVCRLKLVNHYMKKLDTITLALRCCSADALNTCNYSRENKSADRAYSRDKPKSFLCIQCLFLVSLAPFHECSGHLRPYHMDSLILRDASGVTDWLSACQKLESPHLFLENLAPGYERFASHLCIEGQEPAARHLCVGTRVVRQASHKLIHWRCQ